MLAACAEDVNRSIGFNQEKAREASQILNDTNKAIQRIDGAMVRLLLMNEQIAAEEQATASSQINENMHHVSDQIGEALSDSQSMESIAIKPVDVVDRVDALVSPQQTNSGPIQS